MNTSSVGAVGQQGQQNTTGYDALRDVDLNDFIKLLVAELQNQDPLNPMENNEILQQISQIREIESNQRLTDTLESVLLGQSMATASNMMDRMIVALTDDSQIVTGRVDRVTIEEGQPKLHVGDHTVDLQNVSQILSESTDTTSDT